MSDVLQSAEVKKAPIDTKDTPPVSQFIEKSVHKSRKTGKERERTKLSKEGHRQLDTEWKQLVSSDPQADFSSVRGTITTELQEIQKAKAQATDTETAQFLRLKELSFKKRLEHFQRVYVEGQMSASNSAWNELKRPLIEKLYPHVSPKLAEVVVMDKIAKLKMQVTDVVEDQLQKGNISKDRKGAMLASYDKTFSLQVVDALDNGSDGKTITDILAKVGNGDVTSWVTTDIAQRKQAEQEAAAVVETERMREAQEALLREQEEQARIQRERDEARARQIAEETEQRVLAEQAAEEERVRQEQQARERQEEQRHELQRQEELRARLREVTERRAAAAAQAASQQAALETAARQKAEDQRREQNEKPSVIYLRGRVDQAAQKQEARVQKSRLLGRVGGAIKRNFHGAAVAVAIVGMTLGGGTLAGYSLGHREAPSATASYVAPSRPSPAVEAAAAAPRVDIGSLPVAGVGLVAPRVEVPITQPAPKDVAPSAQPSWLQQNVDIKSMGPSQSEAREDHRLDPVRVEVAKPAREIPPRVEAASLRDNRIGFRINSTGAINASSELNSDNIRIVGDETILEKDGTLEKRVEEMMTKADHDNKSVLFVFNPSTFPSYDEKGHEKPMPKTLAEVQKDEPAIREAMKQRLKAILKHKSVTGITLGNEFINRDMFWHGSTEEFAYFEKLGIDIIHELDPEGNVKIVLSPLPEPASHQNEFAAHMAALKKLGVDVSKLYIGVNAYTDTQLRGGIKQVRDAGAKPMVTEIGVDLNGGNVTAKTQALMRAALELTDDVPVFMHQLDGTADIKNEDWVSKQLGIAPLIYEFNTNDKAIIAGIDSVAKLPVAKATNKPSGQVAMAVKP